MGAEGLGAGKAAEEEPEAEKDELGPEEVWPPADGAGGLNGAEAAATWDGRPGCAGTGG